MTLQPDPREVYAFMDPAEDLARARKHELVREVKRLVDLTAHIDVERADRDELARLADAAAELADRLEPPPGPPQVGGRGGANRPRGAPRGGCGGAGGSAEDPPRCPRRCSGTPMATSSAAGPPTHRRTRGRSGMSTVGSWPRPSTT